METFTSHHGGVVTPRNRAMSALPLRLSALGHLKQNKLSLPLSVALLSPWVPVRPDLAIYWTLGNFVKPLATIKLPQSPTFLGNFCKGVKIIHFSSETIFGQLL